MKRIVLTATVIAIVAMAFGQVFAQEVVDPINYGTQVGLNISNITGPDKPDNVKTKIGLAAGAFLSFAVTDMFSIQPEVMYSMKGAKYEFDENIGGTVYHVKETLKLDYLEVPILAKVSFVTQGNMKPSVFAGPYLGFLLSAKAKGEVAGQTATVDVKDNFKSTDFGLTFGAGIGMKMTKGMPFLNVRYSLGLSKLGKEFTSNGVTVAAADIKNSNIQITLGYAFK